MSGQAKYWGLGVVIVLLVAIGLVWRGRSAAEEEGQRLLRRAKAAGQADAASAKLKIMPTGRLDTMATTSSGEQVKARIETIGDESGNVVGHAPRLDRPLNGEETVTLTLPGGGSVTIGAVSEGQAAASKSP